MLLKPVKHPHFSANQIENLIHSRLDDHSSKFGLSFGECKDCNEEDIIHSRASGFQDKVNDEDDLKYGSTPNDYTNQIVAQDKSDDRRHQHSTDVFGIEKSDSEHDVTCSHQLDEIPTTSQHALISLDTSHGEISSCLMSKVKNPHLDTCSITMHSSKPFYHEYALHERNWKSTTQPIRSSSDAYEDLDKSDSEHEVFADDTGKSLCHNLLSLELTNSPYSIGDEVEVIIEEEDKSNNFRIYDSKEKNIQLYKKYNNLNTSNFSGTDFVFQEDSCDSKETNIHPNENNYTVDTRHSKNSSNFSDTSSELQEDIELTIRALRLQEDLRKQEMEELAFEAERAAEAGDKKFVGEATEFTLIGSTNNNNMHPGDASHVDSSSQRSLSTHSRRSAHPDKEMASLFFFPLSIKFSDPSHRTVDTPPPLERKLISTSSPFERTPPRPRKRRPSFSVFNQDSMSMMPVCESIQFSGDTYHTYSPSRAQLSESKIYNERVGVMSRRNIVEVIPTFEGMHQHMRMHLSRSKVDPTLLSSYPRNVTNNNNLFKKDSTGSNGEIPNPTSHIDHITAKNLNPLRSLSSLVFPESDELGEKNKQYIKEFNRGPQHSSSRQDSRRTQDPDIVDCPSMIACGAGGSDFGEMVYSLSRDDWVSPVEAFDNSSSSEQENILVPEEENCCTDPNVQEDVLYMSILVSELNDPVQRRIHSLYTLPPSPYIDGEDYDYNASTQRYHNLQLAPRSPWNRIWQTFESLVPPSPIQNVLSLQTLTRDTSDSNETLKSRSIDSSLVHRQIHLISKQNNKSLPENSGFKESAICPRKPRPKEYLTQNEENGLRSLTSHELFPEDDTDTEFSNVKIHMDFEKDQSLSSTKNLHNCKACVTDSEKLDNHSNQTRITGSTVQMSDGSFSSESRNPTDKLTEVNQRFNVTPTLVEIVDVEEKYSEPTEYRVKGVDKKVAVPIPRMIETEMSHHSQLIGRSDKMTMSEDAKTQLNHLCSRFKILSNAPIDIHRTNDTDLQPVDKPDIFSHERSISEVLKSRNNPDDLYIKKLNEASYLLDEQMRSETGQLDSRSSMHEVIHERTEEQGLQIKDFTLQKDKEHESRSFPIEPILTEAESNNREVRLNQLETQHRSSSISDFFDQMGRLSPFSWKDEKSNVIDDQNDIAFIENYFYSRIEKGSVFRSEKFVNVDGDRKLPFCDAADEKCAQMGMYAGCSDLSAVVIDVARDFLPTDKYSRRDPTHRQTTSLSSNFLNIEDKDNQNNSNTYKNPSWKESDNWIQYYRAPSLKAKKGALEVQLDEESNCSLSLSSRNSCDYDWWEGIQGQEGQRYNFTRIYSEPSPGSREYLQLEEGSNQGLNSAHCSTITSKKKNQHLLFDSIISMSEDEME